MRSYQCLRWNRFRRSAFLTAAAVWLLIPAPAPGSNDTLPPQLKAVGFAPAAIRTITGAAEVVVAFVATDDASGLTYFEAAFVDPSGASRQAASARFAPALSAANTVRIVFPRFANSGAWTLASVFLSDSAGNTLVLDTDALVGLGFPTRLEVHSTRDTVSPKLAALNFAPISIDTSKGPAEVKLSFTATDDLAGVDYIEFGFVSPSGVKRLGGSVKLGDAPSVSNSYTVTFPQLSEPGQWTLGPVFLSDAAGNTLVLDTEGLAGLGFRTALDVKSSLDTIGPRIVSVRFAPDTIDTSRGAATVMVDFAATDNLSGVKSLEVVFANPSRTARRSASAVFSPATEMNGSINVDFPRSSDTGQWTLSGIFLSDAAGNTLVLDEEAVPGVCPRTALEVKSISDSTAPYLSALRFSPDAIDTSERPATVKVEFSASDNSSGVRSIEVVFVGPSGIARQIGSARFAPATELSGSVTMTFSQGSEAGSWKVASVMMTDDAGNTLLLDEDTLPARQTLQVR